MYSVPLVTGEEGKISNNTEVFRAKKTTITKAIRFSFNFNLHSVDFYNLYFKIASTLNYSVYDSLFDKDLVIYRNR